MFENARGVAELKQPAELRCQTEDPQKDKNPIAVYPEKARVPNPSSPPSLVSSRIPGFFGLNRKNPRRCPARKSFAISEFTFTYFLFVQL